MDDDEEEYDELPQITVKSSAIDASRFLMPCASELAAQRARADRCERELRRLRAGSPPRSRSRSDSSGSETEAALAAAVTALRVREPARALAPPLGALLAAAAPLLPPAPFLAEYLRAARAAPAVGLAERALDRICGALAAGARWELAAAEAAAAWLCCALASREAPRLGPRLPRAAHALLDELAPAAAGRTLARVLPLALPSARARLDLSDALRSGGAGAEALADTLCAADARRPEGGEASARYVSLQMAGRARAHAAGGRAGGAADAALQRALAAAAPSTRDVHPDALKVSVAATKLRMLFHVKK